VSQTIDITDDLSVTIKDDGSIYVSSPRPVTLDDVLGEISELARSLDWRIADLRHAWRMIRKFADREEA